MPQADLSIANQSGLAFRQDLNGQLQALGTLMSGSSAPSTTYAYMWWADTSTSPATIRMRNGANSAWIVVGTSDTANLGLLPSATAASTYAPLTGTGASGTWPISISGNAATATTATTATTLSGTGSLSALDYSYTADFPSVRPSLLLDFANTKALDPRVSFSRASTGTYVGADGLIKTAAINEPRFDHNPSTGESLGLLVEEARTNLIVGSQTFNTGGWTVDGISVTNNATTAPDGTNTAASVVQGTGNNRTYHFDNNGAGSRTLTIFAKSNAGSSITLTGSMSYGANQVNSVTLNTSNGAITTATGCSSVSLPNGWYRFTIPVTVSIGAGNGNYYAITGPASSVYIWGMQVEAASFPTSYIPTTTATVTRSADVAEMTGTNFSGWYRQAEGTILAEYNRSAGQGTASCTILTINDTTINEDVSVFWNGTYVIGQVVTGYATQASLQTSAISLGKIKNALTYKANDFALCGNGGTVNTDTSGAVAAVTQMQIGTKTAYSANAINGCVSRIAYYPARLTNAQLQNLTAV